MGENYELELGKFDKLDYPCTQRVGGIYQIHQYFPSQKFVPYNNCWYVYYVGGRLWYMDVSMDIVDV